MTNRGFGVLGFWGEWAAHAGGGCSGTLVKNVISDSPGGGVLMRCVCACVLITALSLSIMI